MRYQPAVEKGQTADMHRSTWEMIHYLQLQEILKHKWIESEKAGVDLGNQAVMEWIEKYAADFRCYWEKRLREEAAPDDRER